ncbi:hypothetical protein PINS_up003153 [Pythium insidiosum]|nr:hypothetical protein PINS_up003153 [Pythium insidiosum]
MAMAGDSMMFTDGVASEEQLERALDDLPFLDTENLAMDPALALGRPNSTAAPGPSAARQETPAPAPHDASSSSASSGGEDDDDEDDDTASANSASPLPSPSPTMSPVMSRSPSP